MRTLARAMLTWAALCGCAESALAAEAQRRPTVTVDLDNLSSLLEPMIMAILGILVGGLVVAMYLPIFKMGSVI